MGTTDIYYFSFTVPKEKEGYLSQIKQFVAPYNAIQSDDGMTFEIDFELLKEKENFKKELYSNFPFLYGI